MVSRIPWTLAAVGRRHVAPNLIAMATMFNEEGFLSPNMANWTKAHQKRNNGWFAFARELNRLAHRMHATVINAPPPEDKHMFVARTLFLKCHTSFQSALLLAQHGLTGDAQTVLRSAFEAVFCFGACKAGSDICERLVAADTNHKQKVARRLIALPGDLGLDDYGIEKMRNYLSANPGKYKQLDLSDFARDAGLLEVYDVYYRSLSHDAAHPSVSSLSRFTASDDTNVYGFRYGPDVQDVGVTVAYSCVVGLYMLKLGCDLFGGTEYDRTLTELWPTYTTLISETFPDRATVNAAA